MVTPTFAPRLAAPSDSERLYAIHKAAMREYVVQTWGSWDEAEQHAFWREHWFPGREVIEVDGEMAGFLDVEDRDDGAWVGNIELDPRFQGQGIGTAILRDIQLDAARSGLDVRLQVLKVNPARRLYERLGFEVTGETETHWQMAWAPARR
ncbi:MAG: GNAT family N-acetyltransferase [Tepidiformaceae bacterium]